MSLHAEANRENAPGLPRGSLRLLLHWASREHPALTGPRQAHSGSNTIHNITYRVNPGNGPPRESADQKTAPACRDQGVLRTPARAVLPLAGGRRCVAQRPGLRARRPLPTPLRRCVDRIPAEAKELCWTRGRCRRAGENCPARADGSGTGGLATIGGAGWSVWRGVVAGADGEEARSAFRRSAPVAACGKRRTTKK